MTVRANALAEAANGLNKAEVIRKHGPWRSLELVELATAGWVDWWNHRRLHTAIGDIPPAEYEALYDQHHKTLPRGRVIQAAEPPHNSRRFTF